MAGVAAALLMVLSVTACTGARDAGGVTPQVSGPTDPPPSVGLVPTPDKTTADAYVKALEAIDPEIVDGNPARAVSRGRNQCDSIRNFPDDREKLIDHVQIRFNTDRHPNGFDRQTSAKILDVVRAHLCPN